MEPDLKDLVTEEEKKWLRKELVSIDFKIQSGNLNFDLYLKKSAAELALGLKQQSIESAKMAVSLNEANIMAWYQLGTAYQEIGQFKRSRDAYQRALDCFVKMSDQKKYSKFAEYMLDNMEILELLARTTEKRSR